MARAALAAVLCAAVLVAQAACVHFTIVHVTDVHGWVNGHPHTPELDADFGDFESLVAHLDARAKKSGDVFMLYDSGDITEGTGISDAFQIHGYYVFPIIEDVGRYSALTMGNHDLGHDNQVVTIADSFAPFWNAVPPPRYLTANSLDIRTHSPIGERYNVLEVAPGVRVMSFGFMYNFTQHSDNSEVVPISDSLQEEWFYEAMMQPGIDVYAVTCHIDPQAAPELQQIYAAIRSYHPDTPLLLFTGHRHRLFFEWFDSECFAIESGKYFENIGVVDFDLENGRMHHFEYQWVSTSVANFRALAGKNESSFLTPKGAMIKEKLRHYTRMLNLDESVGCAAMTYDVYGLIEDEDSIWNLWIESIIPALVFDYSQPATPYYMTNTQALRSNLFEGEVNRNDIWTCQPFNDTFKYSRMPGDVLLQFIAAVNGSSPQVPSRFDRARNFPVERDTRARRTDSFKPEATRGYVYLPDYYFSQAPVDPDDTYDLVLTLYDATTFEPLLVQLGAPKPEPYFSTLTETSALGEYFVKYLPCGSSCECSHPPA